MFNFTSHFHNKTSSQVILISDDVTYEVLIAARYPKQGMTNTTVCVDIIDSATNRWFYSTLSKQWESGKVNLIELVSTNV